MRAASRPTPSHPLDKHCRMRTEYLSAQHQLIIDPPDFPISCPQTGFQHRVFVCPDVHDTFRKPPPLHLQRGRQNQKRSGAETPAGRIDIDIYNEINVLWHLQIDSIIHYINRTPTDLDIADQIIAVHDAGEKIPVCYAMGGGSDPLPIPD